MLSERMEEMLNKQVTAEFYAGYLYLAISGDMDAKGLPGIANWYYVQYQEELWHAIKIYRYILERGGTIELGQVDKPPKSWDTPMDAAQAGLEHEKLVTAMINDLVDLAQKEKDHATNNFLQWYVEEQVEEEANAEENIARLELVDKSGGGGLFMVDREMGQRLPKFQWPEELGQGD